MSMADVDFQYEKTGSGRIFMRVQVDGADSIDAAFNALQSTLDEQKEKLRDNF